MISSDHHHHHHHCFRKPYHCCAHHYHCHSHCSHYHCHHLVQVLGLNFCSTCAFAIFHLVCNFISVLEISLVSFCLNIVCCTIVQGMFSSVLSLSAAVILYFEQVLGCVISTLSLTEEMSFLLILFCVYLYIYLFLDRWKDQMPDLLFNGWANAAALHLHGKLAVMSYADTRYVSCIPVAMIAWLRRLVLVTLSLYSLLQYELTPERIMPQNISE